MTARRLLGAALLLAALLLGVDLPWARGPVIVVGVLSALLVWRRPAASFAVAAIAIAAVDLTPWTGRAYFNEWDVCLLAALGAALGTATFKAQSSLRRRDVMLFAGVLLAYLVGVGVGFLRAPLGDDSWGNVYDHPLNALRVARPVAYALAFWVLLGRYLDRRRAWEWFLGGSAVGLAATVAAVAWERLRFCGLIDLTSEFRVTGPFADMHIGGATLDAYLVMTIPLLGCLARRARRTIARVALATLALGAFYAVCVTLSRAPLAIVAVQGVVLAAIRWRRTKRSPGHSVRNSALPLATLAAAGMLLIATPQLLFRFSTVAPDSQVRLSHWTDSLSVLNHDPLRWALGVGCGGFPREFRARVLPAPAGDYQFVASNRYADDPAPDRLKLTGGQPIYFGQYVDVRPDARYTIAVRARLLSPSGGLSVKLFEKSLLQSYEATGFDGVFADVKNDHWTTKELVVNSGDVGRAIDRPPFPPQSRPVLLSFWASPGAEIEISRLQLLDKDGNDLVANGDFRGGHDRWWWTADDHLSWQAKNLFVELLIEQGLLGLIAFTALALAGVTRLTRDALRGVPDAAPLACSLGGFLATGLIDGLIDSPRILLLFLLLVGFALIDDRGRAGSKPADAQALAP